MSNELTIAKFSEMNRRRCESNNGFGESRGAQ